MEDGRRGLGADVNIFDRYIIRQVVVSFLFSLVAVVFIFLVIDMMEKLDDFVDANAPVSTIIEYYVAFTPEIIKLMTPVAMLLAALFVTGRLTNQNELAAMKSSGVSLYRMLIPFLGVALVVSLGSIYFNAWIVPSANQKKFALERRHLHHMSDSFNRFNLFLQDSRTRIVSLGYYEPQAQTASRVSIEEFADTNLSVLVRRYDAIQMKWVSDAEATRDSIAAGWILLDGTRRDFESTNKQLIKFFQRVSLGKLSLTPAEIAKKQEKPDEMDYFELRDFIASQQRAGQDVSRWLVDYHNKIAFPFASVIMVLFAVPFAANRRRSGVAVEFGICVATTFTYLAFMKTSQVFGYNGDLNPLFTAWMANLIFLALAFANLARVQK